MALVVSVDVQCALKIDVLIRVDGRVRFNRRHDDEFSLNLALGASRIERHRRNQVNGIGICKVMRERIDCVSARTAKSSR